MRHVDAGKPKQHCIVGIMSYLIRFLNNFAVADGRRYQYNDSICMYFHRKEGIKNWLRDTLQIMITAVGWSRASAAQAEAAAILVSGPRVAAAPPDRLIQASVPPAAKALPSAGPQASAHPAVSVRPSARLSVRVPRHAGITGGAGPTGCPCLRRWRQCLCSCWCWSSSSPSANVAMMR